MANSDSLSGMEQNLRLILEEKFGDNSISQVGGGSMDGGRRRRKSKKVDGESRKGSRKGSRRKSSRRKSSRPKRTLPPVIVLNNKLTKHIFEKAKGKVSYKDSMSVGKKVRADVDSKHPSLKEKNLKEYYEKATEFFDSNMSKYV
jgi:hypothetical protein